MKKTSTLGNFLWRFLERCGAQIVTLIVSIVLARILDPDVYGSIAIVTVIITILQVFVDSGLGTSLIQKKDSDDLDFSTVFYFKVVLCAFIYLLLFFLAPVFAKFYNDENLIWVIRILGITILISSVKNIEQAYVSRHLLFKKFFFATLIGTVLSAVVGLIMAFTGFGIWALVAQTLTNNFVDTLILWFTVGWRPKKLFSFKRLKQLSSFGWKILVIGLLNEFYESARQLIIGKKYSNSELAFYNRGKQFPSLIVTNLSMAFDSVLLPTMSNVQEDLSQVKFLIRKSIVISSYALMPLMFGMAAVSNPFVKILLGVKWIDTVFFVQIFAVSFAFYSINSAFMNGINSIGRSNVLLFTEIIKKIFGVAAIICTMFISVKFMALSFLICSLINVIINMYPLKKYFGYKYGEQIKDIFINLSASVLMFAIIYPINFLAINDWLKLAVMIPSGAVIYFLIGFIFHLEGYQYYFSIVCKVLRRLKK